MTSLRHQGEPDVVPTELKIFHLLGRSQRSCRIQHGLFASSSLLVAMLKRKHQNHDTFATKGYCGRMWMLQVSIVYCMHDSHRLKHLIAGTEIGGGGVPRLYRMSNRKKRISLHLFVYILKFGFCARKEKLFRFRYDGIYWSNIYRSVRVNHEPDFSIAAIVFERISNAILHCQITNQSIYRAVDRSFLFNRHLRRKRSDKIDCR